MNKKILSFLVLGFGLLAVSPTAVLASNEQLTISKICSPAECDAPDSFPFTIVDSNNIISGSFTLDNSNNYTKTYTSFQNAQTSTTQEPTNNYTITEGTPSGWDSPSIDCGGANIEFNTSKPNSVSFEYTPNAMEPLAHIHCTFTNNKQAVSGTGSAGGATTTTTTTTTTATATNAETTTFLSSSVNPSLFGQAVTFTATISSSSGGTPTGSVNFLDGKTSLGFVPLNTRGMATFTISELTVGTRSITASYSGNDTYSGSSDVIIQTINSDKPATTTTSVTNTTTTSTTAPGGMATVQTNTTVPSPSPRQPAVSMPSAREELPQLEGYVAEAPTAKAPGFFARIWNFFFKRSPAPAPIPQGGGDVVVPLKSDLKVRIVVESPAGTYNAVIAPANTVISVAPTTPATMIKCPAAAGVAFLPSTLTCSKLGVQSSSVKLTATQTIPNATFYKYANIPVFTSGNTASILPVTTNGCTSSNPNVLNITCSMFLNGNAVSREIQAVYKCKDTFPYNPTTKQCEKKGAVDLCPNIAGTQTTIPAGMVLDANGRCVPRLADLCVIGGTGPGGGIVFYVASSPQPWGRCLEATLNTWKGGVADPATIWGCKYTSILGAQGIAIGTGQANTTAIINACTTSGIAAHLADNLVFGGKSDWFLPSKDELAQMYLNKAIIGGFATGNYWSSSEYAVYAAYGAWIQHFNGGIQNFDSKSGTYSVRPIRAIP